MTPQPNEPEPIVYQALEPVLSAVAMREADAYTIEEYGIPGFALMEVAGRTAVAAAVRRYGRFDGRHVVICCGKGNNGGDGFVMARGFVAEGANVTVLTLSDPESMSDDAARNHRLLQTLSGRLDANRLSLITYDGPATLSTIPHADLYVDALLGTGLTKPLHGPILAIVEWLNARPGPVFAVDVPTGLHSDTGQVLGAAVKAQMTVTMGARKTGLLVNDGPEVAGEVHVAEIGIPRFALLERSAKQSCAFRTTDALVSTALPRRSATAHKYSVGMTLVIGGSPGLTGAPVMASTAAARAGSGAVVCACHEQVQPVLASRLTEIMTLALPAGRSGEIDRDRATDALKGRIAQASALLVGCGIGRAAGTAAFVRHICTITDLPLVIDADGLNAFIDHTDLFARHAGGRWILTPHAGEFARLTGNEPGLDRVETARTWSARWNCILILKGMPAIVAAPNGRVYISATGNPALATAGTGDVLAGLTAGLLSQGLSPELAAACAVHLGGACADTYAATRSPRTMQATDLLAVLPVLLAERFRDVL